MRRLFALAALLVGVPAGAAAAPFCQSDSLSAYIGLAQPCQVGELVFGGFQALPSFTGGADAIAPDDVMVVPSSLPTGAQLAFVLSATAGPGDLLGVTIKYSGSGGPISGVSLDLSGASATGSGVVTAIEDVCLGGAFGATPLDCSGPDSQSLVVAADRFGAVTPDGRTFAFYSFFDVFVDIVLDGADGSAAFGEAGAVVTGFAAAPPPTAVPEPSSLAFALAGLLGALLARRESKR